MITPTGVGTVAAMACCAVPATGLIRRMLVSGTVTSTATTATTGTLVTPVGGSARPLTGQCNVSR